jgi:hypothetical protein
MRPHLSARGKEKKRKRKGGGYRFGEEVGWGLVSAQVGCSSLFFDLFLFLLFTFCFLISFITFAFQNQTRSNQLQKFSKIKNNISKQ